MSVLLSADVAVVVGIRAAARISGRLRGRAFDTLADSAQHARLQRRRAAARRALLRLRGRLLAVALGGWRANGGELRRRRKVRRDTAAAARCLWAASQPKDTNHDQAGAVLTVMYRTIFCLDCGRGQGGAQNAPSVGGAGAGAVAGGRRGATPSASGKVLLSY